MRHLRPLDTALLAILVPLWVLSFAQSLRSSLDPPAFPPLVVSGAEQPGGYPLVVDVRSWPSAPDPAPRRGDRLVEMAGADLRDVGGMAFFLAFVDVARPGQPLSLVIERDGVRSAITVTPGSFAMFRTAPIASLAFAFTALFLLLRARPLPIARRFFQAFICAAVLFSSWPETWVSLAVHGAAMTLTAPLSIRAFQVLPNGVAPARALPRFAPWLFVVLGPLHMSRFGFPIPHDVAVPGVIGGTIAELAILLAITTRRYRQADPIGRRRLRWVLFGLYCGCVPPILAALLAGYDPRFTPVYVVSLSALALIPLSLLIAIARYNLFDVDRLISATASYNILLVGLLAGGLVIVPRAAEGASSLLGLDPFFGQVAVSLALASLVVPAHRLLRPAIERSFFAERWALDQGIQQLLADLERCPDPEALTKETGEGLHRLLRPETCVLYGRADERYGPIFVQGRAVPPAFEPDGPLIATLRLRRVPLALDWGRRRALERKLSPFERATLETLDAEVVVPIARGDQLHLVLCLGPRSSGDVYTPTDVRLLATVADKVASCLTRFDQEQVIRQARQMQDALRRYVPGAVAEELERGGDVELGEREVTVLFADLRGYATYAEDRRPEEIFSTVNRYTQTLSDVVRRHGGSVVEFNGDGMMVVFGAPRPLAHKERAALEAGREVIEAVRGVEPEGGVAAVPLAVGIGIATGPGFVGSIRAIDRLIWSVVGNTTNLAARLQALTRDMDACIVTDRATHAAAGFAATGFVLHEQVPIRGHHEPQDLYALPLDART